MPDTKPAELGILGQLLGDHLDAGYDEAHRRRDGEPPRRSHRAWLVGGALLAGLLLGIAASDATQRAPGADQARRSLADDVQNERAVTDGLSRRADELAKALEAARDKALEGNTSGRDELDRLAALNEAAGAVAVRGPGLALTVRDPVDRGQDQRGERSQTVLDRDLQVLVNALWSSGAEAIAVGGVRLQPRATIRQAGGAMLVDNRPITQPYVLEAIGNPAEMRAALLATEAYRRFLGFAADYGTVFLVEQRDELNLPAAVIGDSRKAQVLTTEAPPTATSAPRPTTGRSGPPTTTSSSTPGGKR